MTDDELEKQYQEAYERSFAGRANALAKAWGDLVEALKQAWREDVDFLLEVRWWFR